MYIEDKIMTEKVVRIYVSPCLKCGSEEVILFDCGYSSFNVGGGKCNSCGNKTSVSVGASVDKQTLANIWNNKNDINTLIKANEKEIFRLHEEINHLKHLANKRASENKGT